MTLNYSCFISYSNAPGINTFVSLLETALEKELGPILRQPLFVDRKRLKGGDFYTPALAHALCQSVCMVMVYSPIYFDEAHPYCTQEFVAMERLEAQRLQFLGQDPRHTEHGFIIPVILRGAARMPTEIRSRRHCFDFSQHSLAGSNVWRDEYNPHVFAIAEQVERLHQLLSADETRNPCENCPTFTLPTADEIRPRLRQLRAPAAAFPGRAA